MYSTIFLVGCWFEVDSVCLDYRTQSIVLPVDSKETEGRYLLITR